MATISTACPCSPRFLTKSALQTIAAALPSEVGLGRRKGERGGEGKREGRGGEGGREGGEGGDSHYIQYLHSIHETFHLPPSYHRSGFDCVDLIASGF